MSKMPSVGYGAPIIIVVVLMIGDFLCIKPTTSQSIAWTRQQNSSWTGPSTTPWPALGSRKPYNKPAATNSEGTSNKVQNTASNINKNINRNVGVDLSYGPGTAGNPQSLNNTNKGPPLSNINGVALSYGLNYNKNNPSPNQKVTAVSSSSQNVNAPKAVVTYSNVVRQNSNDPNSLKSSQVVNSPNVKSVTQKIDSQSSTANANKLQQSGIAAGSSIQPTTPKTSTIDADEELRQFSEALLRKDVNNAGKYVTINYQAKTTSRSQIDEAPLPLLTIQKEAYNIPSISDLLQLHNNYILETNVNEHVSAQEKMEENTLLDTILSTSVMQHTKNFLIQKGVIAKDPRQFKDKMKEIWFNMYSRGQGRIGSSGFEHVFLAEIKNQDVTGLHNWVYFYDAEAKKLANYLGYMKTLEMNNNKGAILKYHMTFNGIDKPVSSMFIGTSPELEIALYTTCFLLRPDQVCPLRFDGKRFIVRTYTFRYRGKNMIGSAFPEI